MSDFDDLLGQIEDGKNGKNMGLSMGHDRLNRYIGIRKRIYTLVFGSTGSGKSAYVHSSYILNPYEDFKLGGKGRFKVILFSMERSKVYILAKWLSRKIFLDKGILIPLPKMMGWWKNKLDDREFQLIKDYQWYIEDVLNYVDIIEGAINPTGIYKYIKKYAEDNGRIDKLSEFKSIYIPNEPNEIVIPIIDHIALIRPEKSQSKKEAIDKTSEHMQHARDFYGYTPVVVSQMNRDLNNPIYQKKQSFEPTIDSIKESGRPGEDSDCILSLFDPSRYDTEDPSYEVDNFLDIETGARYYRNIKVLKNTYGEDQVRSAMAFHGAIGEFKELPRPSDMEKFDYQSLFDGSYFLKKK